MDQLTKLLCRQYETERAQVQQSTQKQFTQLTHFLRQRLKQEDYLLAEEYLTGLLQQVQATAFEDGVSSLRLLLRDFLSIQDYLPQKDSSKKE